MTTPSETLDADRATLFLRRILKSQYHAALAMLRESIERCPDDLWFDTSPTNAFWGLAYHALFFTHLYLGSDSDSFERWAEHQRDNQNEDGIGGPHDPASSLPVLPRPYTKEQALRYWQICDDMVDGCIDALDMRRRDSGFYWYRMSKLEHQLVNLRHVQHHTGQLADRLRAARGIGIRWVGARHPAAEQPSAT